MKVGDKLYGFDLKEFTVSKIGRKYFEVKEKRGKFHIGSLILDTDGAGRQFRLYADRQVLIDRKEADDLYRKIQGVFSHFYTTPALQQLRDIAKILNL